MNKIENELEQEMQTTLKGHSVAIDTSFSNVPKNFKAKHGVQVFDKLGRFATAADKSTKILDQTSSIKGLAVLDRKSSLLQKV